MSWLGWAVCGAAPWAVGLLAYGLLTLRAYRLRGTWVLNPQAPPHHCRKPGRPRRHARRWRCNTCGTLYESRQLMILDGCAWLWDEVSPVTNLTERQEWAAKVEQERQAR
jgi:hypothetical protein